MSERRRHLAQTARILLRAEQLFSAARQRLDYAVERLGPSLRANLNEHWRLLAETASILRSNRLARQFALNRERSVGLARRLGRALRVRVDELDQQLAALGRVLDSVSYRSVLERGFVLVRSESGVVRRTAGAVVDGEHLALNFADGVRGAVADDHPRTKAKPKTKVVGNGQKSLF